MAKSSKGARVIRRADEFSAARLSREIARLRGSVTTPLTMTLEQVRAGVDAQQRGDFAPAARMVRAMLRDSAVATARWGRLAPQRAIAVKVAPASEKPAARRIAEEADALFGPEGVGLTAATRGSIHAGLVDHGPSFAYCIDRQREDGSRIDKEIRFWPNEFVRWDDYLQMYMARLDPSVGDVVGEVPPDFKGAAIGYEVPIIHGDGRWIIFKKSEYLPHAYDATCVPAGLEWAGHSCALGDWRRASKAHGDAKVLGEMPAGQALQLADGEGAGSLTPEASAFLELLGAVWGGDLPYGIRPSGSKVDFVTNGSSAWQVWDTLAGRGEKALARIYLGTDAILGSQGGAPGVDITALFGVAVTKVEEDLRAIEEGIYTGGIVPWCAVNFGDSSLAPRMLYDLPDKDEVAQREEESRKAKEREERRTAFFLAIQATRESGFVVDQGYVDALAEEQGLDLVPQLPAAPTLPQEAPAQALPG